MSPSMILVLRHTMRTADGRLAILAYHIIITLRNEHAHIVLILQVVVFSY